MDNIPHNKMDKLVQGVKIHTLKDSNTIHIRIVAESKPKKYEIHRVRFTVEDNRINHPGVVTNPTTDEQIIKFHFNSVISDINTS